MPQRGHPLVRKGVDADDIKLRRVKRLYLARIRKESLTAQRELRYVAFDRLAFALLLAFGELDLAGEPRRRACSVDDIRCEGSIRCGGVRKVRDCPVIGVHIE